MKRFLTVAAAMLALTGMGQVAMRKLEDLTNTNLVCVTDYGPQVVSLTAWFSGLQSRTSYWDTAYSWGDWSVAVGANTAAIRILETNTVTRADTNGWETGSHASFLTSAPPQSVVSVNGLTGAVEITAAQIGAVPYTGATQTVNLGGNDLIVSNDLHVGDDVIVGGHIEVDGKINLLGEGRYITGASYISGLVPLDPDTWHVSDRAVSGAFLYSNLRFAVDEAIWTADYRLSWWASTNGLASTQQVADALAPMATTQHVAEAIASQLPGIVYSNSVSALTIYTNASGAATSWWQVASGVTNSGTFSQGTPGAITNGQTGPLTLGQMQMIENGNVGFGGSPETGTGWTLTVTGSSRFNGWVYVGGMIMSDAFVYNASGYSFRTFKGGDLVDAVAWDSNANVTMPNGNLTVANTNTAAEVRSLGGLTLPAFGTNTNVRLIATNGVDGVVLQLWEIAQ